MSETIPRAPRDGVRGRAGRVVARRLKNIRRVNLHQISAIIFVGIPIAVFVGVVGALLIGKHLATTHPIATGTATGITTVEGALFALFGLLIAFSFSGAETRLDARREMIVQEATAIGTAYLRLDLLPHADQPRVKEHFRRYVDARIAFYVNLLDNDAVAEKARAQRLQEQIWSEATDATTRAVDARAAMLVLPALNEMIDITTAREAATRMHVPYAIFGLLGLLSIACAFLAGIGMGRSGRISHLYVFSFAFTLALAAYVILNLEFPRLGFVRFENLDALLVEARAEMR